MESFYFTYFDYYVNIELRGGDVSVCIQLKRLYEKR